MRPHGKLATKSLAGRATVFCSTIALLAACGGAGGSVAGSGGSGNGEGGAGQDPSGAAGDDTQPGNDGNGVIGPSHQLAPGSVSIVGMTSDDWALYRAGETLQATELGEDGATEAITEEPGNVLVRGSVVFNWANMDWTKNTGDLSIWTRDGGTAAMGATTYSEALVSASASGAWLVYATNTHSTKTDIVLASSDFSVNDVLIEGMGLGSDETCSPSLGFVGERLIAGYCEPGSRDATLVRYDFDGEAFTPTILAEQTLSSWSADATGDRVFYQSNAYEGWYTEGGEQYRIDASVSRGFLLPDGSAVLYTVGDQLRRSPVPDSDPAPIVTTGFAEPVAFSADYVSVLYSSKVTYDNGTQRDLRLVATDGFNPEPVELVTEPVAALGRSSMTEDGQYVLYLDEVTPSGGTLHVVGVDGAEVVALPGVLDVMAARGSSIVFTDGGSDPEIYPNVADLKYLDLAAGGEPVLIEAQVLEAKNFQLDAGRGRVVYARSGVDRDSEDPERDGLYWRALP